MIEEWKYVKEISHGLIEVISRHLPGGLRKTTKGLRQNSRSLSRDLNREPAKYEPEHYHFINQLGDNALQKVV
jgi:hypothetical protein